MRLFGPTPTPEIVVAGYVVNEGRSKLLMRYCDTSDLWLPTGTTLRSSDVPHAAIVTEVRERTGLEVRMLVGYDFDEVAHSAYILEADERAISKYDLEERYGAQWLTKDEILGCTCVYEPAKEFAERLLA